MIVAFDGICLADGPLTGVARSFLNGLSAYAELHPAECALLVPADTAVPAIDYVRTIVAPRGSLRRQFALPALLHELRASVLHSSVAAVPLRAPCATIATVHDLPWLHPELGERTTWWRRFATQRALAAADAVLAPSSFTAADARRLLGSRGGKVCVVPHGTTRGAAPDAQSTQARDGPFLVLGDDRPRKNRDRVRRAHALAATRTRDLPPLQFVGPPHAYVEEAEKLRLLRCCRAVVQCSLFEGFGMPVLEALANGAPMVCADIEPFREIAGDAAVFVDPHDVEAIAAGLLRVHHDEPLRMQLAKAGHANVAAFSPAAVARRWRELHESVLR